MKKILSIVVFFSFVLNMSSAQTGLSEAVDFEVMDRFGDEHKLFDILDDGKYVLIDFFAHSCESCCDIAPDINKLYENYGCNEGQVHIISIEAAGNISQLETFEEICGGRTEKPIVTGMEGTGGNVAFDYDLDFYPTILIIAPDKQIVESDIWPFSYNVAQNILESYGLEIMACPLTDDVNEISSISDLTLTPNPIVYNASLEFNLNEASQCNIEIIDMTGKIVSTITNEYLSPGLNKIDVNAMDMAAGTYLLNVQTDKSPPSIIKFFVAN